MFHVSNNLYIGRMNDAGDVRILQFTSAVSNPSPNGVYSNVNVSFDAVVPSASWCSAVASVSNRGEIEGRFYVAQAFHNNVEPFAKWAGLHAQSQA